LKNAKQLIFGFHSIKSAIRSNSANVVTAYIDATRNDGRMNELKSLLEEKNINYHVFEKQRLDELMPKAKHQGAIAEISQQHMKYVTLEDLVEVDQKKDLLFLISREFVGYIFNNKPVPNSFIFC